MPQITSLIYDPSPGVTPGDGSIIRTDQHDAILDLLNGISTENYNLVQKISKKTTTYAILLTDFAIICDATSAGFTVTLPDATSTGISRKMYAIKKSDSTANIVTVATTSAQTIDGASGTTLTQQNEVIFLQSDGTNWQLLGRSLRSILPLANIFTADQTIREDGAAAQLFLEAYGTGNYGHYISKAARGTLASPTASLANDILESIEARGYGATGFSAAGIAQIRLLAGENLTDAHYGSYISFLTTKNTTTTLSEAMRINGDGTWMIWNPAFTFKYTITPAAISADRVLNIPLVTADDTIAVLGLAQTFTKGQTISPSAIPGLTLNAASGLAGSSTVFRGGLYNVAGTTTFTGGTAQTGDYTTNYFDIVTLANGTTSGTITNAATVKIIGAPAAGSNMTITNAYALWVADGQVKMDRAASGSILLLNNTTNVTQMELRTGYNTATEITEIRFSGLNSSSANIRYGALTGWIRTNTAGAEDGAVEFYAIKAGTLTQYLVIEGNTSLVKIANADLSIAGNKIKTTTNTFAETNQVTVGTGILLQPSSGNLSEIFAVAPSGSGAFASLVSYRTSDVLTNPEAIRIGSDVNASGEFFIQSFKAGTGAQRPINVYMLSTKLLSFDTANTITSYVPLIMSGANLNMNTQAIHSGASANTLTIYGGDATSGHGGIVALRGSAFGSNSLQFYSPNNAGNADVERFRIQGNADLGHSIIYYFENLSFTGAVSLIPFTKAGSVSDSDFTTPTSGMMAVDTTNNKLWIRFGSTWKSVVLT